MTDAELIELITYIAHLRDENKCLKEQNKRLLGILKKEGFSRSTTTFAAAGPPSLLSKYFWLEKRRKNERI